jgi:predicted alpha/beta-hydrolase family hydrolase
MTVLEVLFPTPVGVAHLSLDVPSRPIALLVLGHGAGGDIDAPDLLTVREAALALDVAVVRLRQPYRQAGRRAPAPAAQLDVAYAAVLAGIADGTVERTGAVVGLPWVVGGRSSGGCDPGPTSYGGCWRWLFRWCRRAGPGSRGWTS